MWGFTMGTQVSQTLLCLLDSGDVAGGNPPECQVGAIENSTFKDAAGEAIYSIGVELENASLTEVEKAEENEDLLTD